MHPFTSRSVLALLLLLVQAAGLAAPASAQAGDVVVLPGDLVITGNETWTEPRDVPGILFVRDNASLTIVGAKVTVGTLGVEPKGRLTLVSQPNASATLAASSQGWKGLMAGTFEARGLPDAPAIIDGAGGTTSRQENNVLFQGGFYLSGNGTARDLVFTNYTSGMYVSHGGHLDADGIQFASVRGMGLIVADGSIHVRNATFRGTASVYATRLASLDISGATFDSPSTAIVTSAYEARLSGIRVGHATYCLEIYGGAVTIDGLDCRDYRKVGIRATLTLPSREGSVDLSNATISTANASKGEGHGIYFEKLTNASITNTTLGPLPGNGLIEIRVAPRIEGLSIRGAGFFGEIMIDPPAGTSLTPHYNGTSGGNGWFEAKWEIVPKVLLANGSLATNATVAYYVPGNATPIHAHTVQGPANEKGPTLLGLVIFPNGTRYQYRYAALAKSENLTEGANATFVPDGNELLIQLQAPSNDTASTGESRPVSGPGGPLVVVAMLLAAVGWDRSRRR